MRFTIVTHAKVELNTVHHCIDSTFFNLSLWLMLCTKAVEEKPKVLMKTGTGTKALFARTVTLWNRLPPSVTIVNSVISNKREIQSIDNLVEVRSEGGKEVATDPKP